MKCGANGQSLVQNSKTITFATLPNTTLWIDIKLKMKCGGNGQSLVENSKTIALVLLTDIAHSNDIFH